MERRPVLYFLHVPKCGGSTFVALARRNGRPFVPNRNGNPVYADGGLVRFWEWDAGTQLRFLTAGPHDFVANETGLGEALPRSARLVWVTILRDPLDRVLSGFNHARRLGQLAGTDFGEHVRSPRRGRDNLMTRMLAGVPPSRSVTSGDRERARRRLESFDEVLLLPSLADGLARMRRYGWRALSPRRFRSGSRENSDARRELSGDPEGLGRLAEQEAHDVALFESWRVRPERGTRG